MNKFLACMVLIQSVLLFIVAMTVLKQQPQQSVVREVDQPHAQIIWEGDSCDWQGKCLIVQVQQ
jgi:hypothetical protein